MAYSQQCCYLLVFCVVVVVVLLKCKNWIESGWWNISTSHSYFRLFIVSCKLIKQLNIQRYLDKQF